MDELTRLSEFRQQALADAEQARLRVRARLFTPGLIAAPVRKHQPSFTWLRRTRVVAPAMAAALAVLAMVYTAPGAALASGIGDLLGFGADTNPAFSEMASETTLSEFGVLDRPVTQSQLPGVIQRLVTTNLALEDAAGMRIGTAALPIGGDAIVAGNPQIVCLAEEGAEESRGICGTVTEAAAGKLVLFTTCAPGVPQGRVRVLGLVPNWASEIVDQADANSVSVQSNVYELTLPPVDTSMRAVGDGHSLSIPMPLGELSGTQQGTSCAAT